MKKLKLHLGCGADHYNGWINIDKIDKKGKVDLVMDLRKGLPNFRDNSVEAIFSNHFWEHLTWEEGQRLLKDCRRILKVGSIIRTQLPDLETIIKWYSNEPFVDSYNIKQRGTPKWLGEPYLISRAYMINKVMSMWGESHVFVYDEESFRIQLLNAGFEPDKIQRCRVYYPEVLTFDEFWKRMNGGDKPIVEGKLTEIGWQHCHNAHLTMEAEK